MPITKDKLELINGLVIDSNIDKIYTDDSHIFILLNQIFQHSLHICSYTQTIRVDEGSDQSFSIQPHQIYLAAHACLRYT